LKNPLTDYICPKVVKVYDLESIIAKDIPTGNFTEDIYSLLMFRGLEKDEEITWQTFLDGKNTGIAVNDDAFEPSRNVTRAEFVKMLVRSLSCRYTNMWTDSGFRDVSAINWSAPYITFWVKNGWMNGYPDGSFRPDAPITRAEAAKILANAIKLDTWSQTSSFRDVLGTSSFIPYIEALKTAKVVWGTSATTFEPNRTIPRTEVSRIIYRTFLGGGR
jgi:hypothetical protein